ncbi:hypothetical protein DYB35_010911 [Aphanomyces astaci]|uniref:Single-strand DNA deaminase toxin A-like C-terminal domain-containing protein n=1 Tax=Aphanomyces astaci TaxID=112090 RepID=A0A418DR05_APHAT|nr:hypothetical protein DYB35_010911 [Aphanomyces astaci]
MKPSRHPFDKPTSKKMTTYYTFAEFLDPSERDTYLTLPHATQIRRFEAYLGYLQSKQVQFPTSKRAASCYAEVVQGSQDVPDMEQLTRLVEGRTLSGFGVCGTVDGFLGQCELSMGAAWLTDAIGHAYRVENPRVLNSRSFMFGWCHAEKQKLAHLTQHMPTPRLWHAICIVVDRDMCPDCVAFASSLATFEHDTIRIRDPSCTRLFRPSGLVDVDTS